MAWPDALPRRGLYLITPDTTDSLRLFSQCLRVLPARPALLQYRNKSTDPALRLAQAQTLRALTRAAGVGLIINDDVAPAATISPALAGVMPPIATRGAPSAALSANRLSGARTAFGLVAEGQTAPKAT